MPRLCDVWNNFAVAPVAWRDGICRGAAIVGYHIYKTPELAKQRQSTTQMDTAAPRREYPRKTKSNADLRQRPPPDLAVCSMFHALGADVGSFPAGYWSDQTRGWIDAGCLADIPRIDFAQKRHAAPSEDTRRRTSLEKHQAPCRRP